MIKRLVNSRLPIIAYNPSGVISNSYLKSVFEAGCLPIFDTEFIENEKIIKTIKELNKENILFGIRVYAENKELLDFLEKEALVNLDAVIIASFDKEILDDFSIHLHDSRILIETTDIKINSTLEKTGADGLVLRGSEAPGKVSAYTSFVLMQWYLENSDFPIIVHGGVGLYTGAGMFAAGASGVALDSQLYLTEESPLSDDFKGVIEKLEEFDSDIIGENSGVRYRFFSKLATKIVKDLKQKDCGLENDEKSRESLYKSIKSNYSGLDKKSKNPLQSLFYLGQDATFSRNFVEKYKKVSEVIEYFFLNIRELLLNSEKFNPLKENTKFTHKTGCRFPIIQGPMANISDNTEFALKVFESGGLPFFALGSLPENLAEDMIADGSKKLSSYGAGLIGIEALNKSLPSHMETIKKHKVPFALFAGGIPSQISELEKNGTEAWLHTPSMGMLENAILSGCKGFIFEGTEAGGHVGQLTSLILWELALNRLSNPDDLEVKDSTMIFAGGIGTKSGSCFISAMASGLSKKGGSIAVQLGTPYLFTKEIVETGALKAKYQDVVLQEDKTILMGTSVGLTARTVSTPFSSEIIKNENLRVVEKMPLKKRKEAFEHDNIGSLLIAAKGFQPDFEKIKETGKVCYVHFADEECYEKGNFCVGDSLSFHYDPTTIEKIHEANINHGKILSDNLNRLEIISSKNQMINDDIAIIGMGCIYPDAENTDEFWKNIISKKYSIKEVPNNRLDQDLYYDQDKKAMDKTYTKIAGVIDDFCFDHEKFGMDEETGKSISRTQQILLETCSQAMESAGYPGGKGISHDSAAVIVGSCLGNELSYSLNLKYFYPEIKYHLDNIAEYKSLSDEDKEKILSNLKTSLSNGLHFEAPDTATLNIESSKIAQWLGAKGANYVVDGACATSFTAIDCGIKELLSGSHNLVITAGTNSSLAPETFVGFSKMGALSPNGSYPFDERSDGFVLGEGAGVLVLKRMKDAVKDNDRIYGIIKSVGSSSDGKGKAVAAPNEDGQVLALERCFEKSGGLKVEDIDFIEAHGTSTKIGDAAEMETLNRVYGGSKNKVGVSSVKSQIGHLLGGAGAAGLIKTLLAINNKTIPPNGGFSKLSPKLNLENSSIYVVEDKKDWKKKKDVPRRAAISSYGFGGINYHAIIEEYLESYEQKERNLFDDLDNDFNKKRIVVCGVGSILPGAETTDKFFEKLLNGSKDFTDLPEKVFHNEYYADAEEEYRLPMVKAGIVENYKFNSLKYRMPPNTIKSIDRSQLFALDACSQAIEDACGENKDILFSKGNNTGIILGTISGEKHVENVIRTRTVLLEKIISETKDIDVKTKETIKDKLGEALREIFHENCEDTTPGLLSNIVSGRAANFFGANGANFVVDAACASSGIAMDMAYKSLVSGDLDAVLTGGIDTNFYPGIMMVFKRLGLLSDKDTKVFDKRSGGVNLSEGGVVMLMTTLENAEKNNLPVLAEISGSAFRSSPSKNLYAPSQELICKTAELGYGKTPVSKGHTSHMDVFGFSSLMMDKIENQAFDKFFENNISFGSIKPEFGYFKGANPAVAIAKLVLMAKNRILLPNNSYDPEYSIVSDKSKLKPLSKAVKVDDLRELHLSANVFGFGANHGHFIVSSIPPWIKKEYSEPLKEEGIEIDFIEHDNHQQVQTFQEKDGCAALLCGQGSQYPGMMQKLYSADEKIKELMDKAEVLFNEKRGESLLKIMFGNDKRLNSTEMTQPAVFTATAAIYDYAASKGFNPDFFIGHSIGEYSALYCSGILDFEDAMNLVLERSRLMKEADEKFRGRILVVFKESKEAEALIEESEIKDIYIANINSKKQTAVSGLEDSINEFAGFLSKKGIMYKKLELTGAFHTPILKEAAEKLSLYLDGVEFNKKDYSKIISNCTGRPYPNDEKKVKELLVKQIISPVLFTNSIEYTINVGITDFLEVGTGKILTGLLKNMDIGDYICLPCVDNKAENFESLETIDKNIDKMKNITSPEAAEAYVIDDSVREEYEFEETDDFKLFLERNDSKVKEILHAEFKKAKMEKQFREMESFGFYPGKIAVAGVSVGLPGSSRRVFDSDNFSKILSGHNFIDSLDKDEKALLLDKNINRITKSPKGRVEVSKITDIDDVIQLAGKLGYFDISDYGVSYDYDIAISLAMAAGIEALKDAKIPLVKTGSDKDKKIYQPEGFELPEEMQATTGVIMTSLFAGMEKFVKEINSYYFDRFYSKPFDEVEKIYYHIMKNLDDKSLKDDVTEWFFKIRSKRNEKGRYVFDKNLILNITPLGSAHFAQHIKAKGPNITMSGACASTTQACAVAEDWIRNGRCERVIIIGGEAAGKKEVNQWIGSGFLSLGAASVKNNVNEAAKPFDEERHGTILGSGAVSLIIERKDLIKKRGLNGQAELLGTYLGNSAYHTTNIDKEHLAQEMKFFIEKMEKRHGIKKEEFSKHTVFMSHETFTPAKGGSADAEVNALRSAFGTNSRDIKIANTKGFTGHTLGAAIEDAVLVKALQEKRVPKIANLEKIPQQFSDLKLNHEKTGDYRYGLHFSAGFGSHFAFLFIKRLEEERIENNKRYLEWLKSVSGDEKPELKIINNTLCIESAKKTQSGTTQSGTGSYMEKTIGSKKLAKTSQAGVSAEVKIKKIICEQTGYTEDMLDSDLDLEADLGIDTVKQVEIFGKISAEFDLEIPEDLLLNGLSTIKSLGDYIDEQIGETGPGTKNNDIEEQTGEKGTGTKNNEPGADLKPVSKPESKSVSRDEIESRIKKVISDQTGYTEDMLEEDLDLEADLGIDTVKQVEIFGKLSAEFDLEIPEDLLLNGLSTIKSLVDYIFDQANMEDAGNAPVKAEEKEEEPINENRVKRFVPFVKEIEKAEVDKDFLKNKTFLVTSDSHGFSKELIKKVKSFKGKTISIGKDKKADFTIDFKNHDELEKLLKTIKAENKIDGLFLLHSIDSFFENNDFEVEEIIKPFFIITRELEKELNKKGGLISSLTFDSVIFPYGKFKDLKINPVFAGISGMAKTINKEFEKTKVKIADFKSGSFLENKAQLIDLYLEIVMAEDKRVETGIDKDKFYQFAMKPCEINNDEPFVEKNSTILVTGGARGITFEILKELNAGRLIILGRSDINSIDDEFRNKELNEADLMKKLKESMKGKIPIEIKKKAAQIIRYNESLKNLETLRKNGKTKVEYHSCDVTDYDSVKNIFDQYEDIDGIIHGAGLEESQIISKKEMSSFNRVFDTKVKGAKNLIKASEERDLDFFIGFSSVTARFGNESQIDYTGANDMLGRIFHGQSLKNKETIYKVMSWTAWEGAGMATNETVKKVLESRGLTFLPLKDGIEFFLNELSDEHSLEAVFTGADKNFDEDSIVYDKIAPFIDDIKEKEEKKRTYKRRLDLEHDLFLLDHAMNDVPLFLGATGIETMAEAGAEFFNDKTRLVSVSDFKIPYGIKILKKRPKNLEIEAELAGMVTKKVDCSISSTFENNNIKADKKLHYKGTFKFSDKKGIAKNIQIPEFKPVEHIEKIDEIIYHPQRLFMDGSFRTIKEVVSFDDDLLITRISHNKERDFFKGEKRPGFLTDVILVDAMFQTGGLYEFMTSNELVLPYEIEKFDFIKPVKRGNSYLCLTRKVSSDEKTNTYDVLLADEKGSVFMDLKNFKMVKLAKLGKDLRIDNLFKISA